MDQANVSKIPNLMKKIIAGILIALGVIVIIFIVVTVINNFRTTSLSQSVYYKQGLESGSAIGMMGLAPSAPSLQDNSIAERAIAPMPSTAPTASDTGTIQQKVIKTASLSITVNDVDKTVGQITNEAVLVSGFVQNSSVTENEKGLKYANIILRVPAASFENLISKIKSFASLVEREDINGQEVTQEYVDLQASLTHNQAVEAQYLELLKRAQKVEEIIAVRDKLDQVQGQIEQIKGRIRYLDNQTEMATIAVNLTSTANVTLPAEKWQPWEVVKGAVKNVIVGLQNFVNFIIILIFFLLSLIPYLILIYLIYLLVKWLIKKFRKPKQNI
ncbi:MAG: DUF4349 domain-containing protein [Patescibacteria group bacterium]